METLSPLQFIERSRQGLTVTEAKQVAGFLSVSVKELARLVNQSTTTFYRQAADGRFNAATSERLLLLTHLATYGTSVFEDQGKFTRWLRRPLRLLQDQSPLEVLDSTVGIQFVEDISGRIEHGVYS